MADYCAWIFIWWIVSSGLLICFLGQGTCPAQRPDSNRYMESVIVKLCQSTTPDRSKGKTFQRWTLVTHAYCAIRETVLSNANVMGETGLTLLEINNATLLTGHNACTKRHERMMLEQGPRRVQPPMESSQPLTPPHTQAPEVEMAEDPLKQRHEFELPAVTMNQVTRVRVKRKLSPAPPPAVPHYPQPPLFPQLPPVPIQPAPGVSQMQASLSFG